MGTRIYRFGRFRLNPHARELFDGADRINLPVSSIDTLIHLIEHRDRPVGRDELAAAVWGRVDVSEVSLSHAIMRLRRLLGDTGNDQRVIRTVPRPKATAGSWKARAKKNPMRMRRVPPSRRRANSPRSSRTRRHHRASRGHATRCLRSPASRAPRRCSSCSFGERHAVHVASPVGPTPAMVLPAALDAPPDAIWVRLGLMDLVASRLRRGGIATAPSETVVALSRGRDDSHPFDRSAFPDTLIVQPSATLSRGGWHVRLDTRDARRELAVEATAADPIEAARKAADELLIKLGHAPPDGGEGDASVAQATMRQRVNAAVL